MDSDATTRGIDQHRIACSIETLCRDLAELDIPRATAEKLAVAYTLKLEAIRWWEARGYDMGHVLLVADGDVRNGIQATEADVEGNRAQDDEPVSMGRGGGHARANRAIPPGA